MTCANNCRGVNPNAVIIGGTAVLAVAAVSPLQMLTVLGLGVGGLGAAAGGGTVAFNQMMDNFGCPTTRPCRVISYLSLFGRISDDQASYHFHLRNTQSFQLLVPQRPDRRNPGRIVCCSLIGRGGRPRCPRRC